MRQMKSSNQIKRTVICRQLADMELEPSGIQIKRKAAVHAWLPVLSRFKGLSLPSLCHSTLQMTRLADTLNMRYLYHTQPHPRSLTNLNCKIASSLIKTILTSFQISQVYNDGNQKAKSDSDIANTYVIDYLECQFSKVVSLSCQIFHHLISLHGSPSFFSSLPLLCSKEKKYSLIT